MTDHSRIDDLRRRVQKDPASIAFAQLAEECRRAGLLQEAIDVCRSGLALHAGYVSARVTLGRAFIQLGDFDAAQHELEQVRRNAPENLAAIRGLADIHHKRGAFDAAHTYYSIALGLAPNDPELERSVAALAGDVARRAEMSKDTRALQVVAALEQWLAAIHVARAQ